jgi:hypothetical protein
MDFSKESYTATKHFEDIGRMPIGLGQPTIYHPDLPSKFLCKQEGVEVPTYNGRYPSTLIGMFIHMSN